MTKSEMWPDPDTCWTETDGVFLGTPSNYRVRMHKDDFDAFERANLTPFPERTYRIEYIPHTWELDVVVDKATTPKWWRT